MSLNGVKAFKKSAKVPKCYSTIELSVSVYIRNIPKYVSFLFSETDDKNCLELLRHDIVK